jgi:hypothetical protein
MDANELVNALRVVISCYDAVQPGSPVMRELMMWREKFLEAQSKLEDVEKAAYSWKNFLSKNCFEMVTKNPEKLYQEITDGYVKEVKDVIKSPGNT